MKIFVTGASGQLGYDVLNEALKRKFRAIGSDISFPKALPVNAPAANCEIDPSFVQLDITDRDAVMSAVSDLKPEVIIHCAAWTAVDDAEDEDNWARVYDINVKGTQNLANAAKAVDAKMIYLSTDYVFDGQDERPWQPDDKNYAPLSYYGKTKLEGELAVFETLEKCFIIRTSWVFGLNGKNFIKTMVDIGRKHDEVRVVNDQIGTPTYTYDLARLLVDMAETDKYGYYHAANEGEYISWYDYTCEIYRQAGIHTKVIPVSTEEYGLSVAARPYNSRLDRSKLIRAGFTPLPDWKNAVERYLREAKL
ncbi:MAG: dTDP-4-dehydrorhamnose reductase [Mogibacterium sp.]|nr:dTDP-4-dehydrorhamnose reductase [Mogibacterium sp.]